MHQCHPKSLTWQGVPRFQRGALSPTGLRHVVIRAGFDRFGILSGSTTSIVSNNQNEVPIIQSWLPGSDVEETLKEVVEAEHECDLAKKRLSLAKKKVAKAMRS